MEIWIKLNINNIQKIVDYHLPTNEENLDFKLYDPLDLNQSAGLRKNKYISDK